MPYEVSLLHQRCRVQQRYPSSRKSRHCAKLAPRRILISDPCECLPDLSQRQWHQFWHSILGQRSAGPLGKTGSSSECSNGNSGKKTQGKQWISIVGSPYTGCIHTHNTPRVHCPFVDCRCETQTIHVPRYFELCRRVPKCTVSFLWFIACVFSIKVKRNHTVTDLAPQ